MKCANPQCRKRKPVNPFGRMLRGGGVTRDDKWYCSEHCIREAILGDYVMRKIQGRELRTQSYPVTSRSFGAALISLGRISGHDLDRAMEAKRGNGRQPVAHYLLEMGLISRKDIMEALAKLHKVPLALNCRRNIPPALLSMVPAEVALRSGVLPINYVPSENRLSLMMKDPSDITTIITLRLLNDCNIKPFQGDPQQIDRFVEAYYGRDAHHDSDIDHVRSADYHFKQDH
jgi:hypothetical protein